MHLLRLGLVVAAAAGIGGAMVAMSTTSVPRHRAAEPKGKRLAVALDTLEAELQRRFHEVDNVDFGMSRLVRPKQRMHYGPLMPKSPGHLIVAGGPRALVVQPENDTEAAAIRAINASDQDVLIYTAGRFSAEGAPLRVRGPATIRDVTASKTSLPGVEAIAAQAWKNRSSTVPAADGWKVKVAFVDMDNEMCVKCHVEYRPPGVNPYKLGDTAGLILLASRPVRRG